MSSLPDLIFTDADLAKDAVISLFQKYTDSPNHDQNLVSLLTSEAQKFLSFRDFQYFESIQLQTIHQEEFRNSSVGVVSEFATFQFQLKHTLKTYRLQKLSEENFEKQQESWLQNLPNHPLEAEVFLLQQQWQKLEALSQGHYADFSALIVYKLKLAVLQRWWQFDAENGFTIFQSTLKHA